MNERSQEDRFGSVANSAGSLERLCWSAWPCPACSKRVSPIGFLVKRTETSGILFQASPEKVTELQTAWLQEWVKQCNHRPRVEILLPRLGDGSEHIVLIRAEDATVFKVTRPGLFGESYYIENNIVNQKNCSPLDYLLRLRNWKKIFASAPKPLGVTDAGQIVSTYRFIEGVLPTQEAVDSFLISMGLEPVKQNLWIWKTTHKNTEIWLGDARADNFVDTKDGIVPIDIRLWLVEAGTRTGLWITPPLF